MKYKNYILSIIFCLAAANLVRAQSDASNKDTVRTAEILVEANRIRTSALFAPNKVQVLNAKFLSTLNGNKLSDALELADAVFIKDYGFNSGLKTISLNSTQSEHALILLDGIKLNSEQNAQFDLGTIQLDDISRIEISSGGSSSLYGSSAIGGVINIITDNNNIDKTLSVELNSGIGSYGYGKMYLKTSSRLKLNRNKLLNLSLSYSNETAKNNYDYLYFNGFSTVKKQRLNSDYSTRSLDMNVTYKPNSKSSLKLISLYSYWNRNNPGIESGVEPDNSNQVDRNIFSSLSYTREFSSLELKSNLNYKYSLMNYRDPLSFTLQTPINSFYKLNTLVNSTEIKFSPLQNSEVCSGYELSYSDNISNEVYATSMYQAGIYTADKTVSDGLLFDKITLFPSLRYDYYSNIKQGELTGKIGLNVKPLKHLDLTLKSSLGNNFRAPTFNDLFWVGLGNKNLSPERSTSFDAGAYYDFHLLTDNQFEVSYFDINTYNRILWTPDVNGVWRPVNIGEVRSRGVDFGLKSNLKLFDSFSALVMLNYNYGTSIKTSMDYPGDDTYNKQLAYLPQEYFKSSFELSYSFPKSLFKIISFDLFYTHTGKRYIDLENTRFSPFYDLVDANIDVTLNLLKTESSLKFMVNNITNMDYQVIKGYPMPLRNYKFQVGINY